MSYTKPSKAPLRNAWHRSASGLHSGSTSSKGSGNASGSSTASSKRKTNGTGAVKKPASKDTKPAKQKIARPWDDTINDLSVYKPTLEEIMLRKAAHQSKNKDLVELDKLKARIAKARAKEQEFEARNQLPILREVLYDQAQLQETLTQSDRTLAVVKDLFGDDPKRYRGLPSVTEAPHSDIINDALLPHGATAGGMSKLDLLSESIMDKSALNDIQARLQGDDPSAEFQSRVDMSRFHHLLTSHLDADADVDTVSEDGTTADRAGGFTSTYQLLKQAAQFTDQLHDTTLTTPQDTPQKASKTNGAINDTVKVERTRSRLQQLQQQEMQQLHAAQQHQHHQTKHPTQQPTDLEQQQPHAIAAAASHVPLATPTNHSASGEREQVDLDKLKHTLDQIQLTLDNRQQPMAPAATATNVAEQPRPQQKPAPTSQQHNGHPGAPGFTEQHRGTRPAANPGLSTALHKATSSALPGTDKVLPGSNLTYPGTSEGFVGYTASLLDTIAKLTTYVKQSESQMAAEATMRELLVQDIQQNKLLIDALTNDLITTQEEYALLQMEFTKYKTNTEANMQAIVETLSHYGIEVNIEDPKNNGVIATSTEAQHVLSQQQRPATATMLSVPKQSDSPAAGMKRTVSRRDVYDSLSSQRTTATIAGDDDGAAATSTVVIASLSNHNNRSATSDESLSIQDAALLQKHYANRYDTAGTHSSADSTSTAEVVKRNTSSIVMSGSTSVGLPEDGESSAVVGEEELDSLITKNEYDLQKQIEELNLQHTQAQRKLEYLMKLEQQQTIQQPQAAIAGDVAQLAAHRQQLQHASVANRSNSNASHASNATTASGSGVATARVQRQLHFGDDADNVSDTQHTAVSPSISPITVDDTLTSNHHHQQMQQYQ